jgi:hypothetical protein
MDYDSITGRLAIAATGLVATTGQGRVPRPAKGRGAHADRPRPSSRQTRRMANRHVDKSVMADGSNRVSGVDATQQTASRMDTGARKHRGSSVERLAEVKPYDFWVLFIATLIFWAAMFGSYLVYELMKAGAL